MRLMVFFVCLLLELISGMEVDLFVPSFPLIQACFDLTPFRVELTLGINLIAYCMASFWASPIAERYGKKNAIVMGTITFTIGSVFCAYADVYEWVLLGRAMQGFGIAFPCVLAYVVIADHYTEEEQTRFLGYMNGAVTLGMSLAPVIGCFVADTCDWRGNFYLLSAFGFFALFSVFFFLPKDDGKRTSSVFNFKDFIPVFKSKTTVWLIVAIVLLGQGYWVFIALSPILYIEKYGVSIRDFGYYQGALAFSFSLVSIFGGRLIHILGHDLSMIYSMRILVLSGFAVLWCLFTNAAPLWITFSMCLHSMAIALPLIILWPKFISLTENHKTERSSAATAGRLISTAFFVQTVSFFYDESFLYVAIAVMLVSFACYPICLHSYRLLIKKNNNFS